MSTDVRTQLTRTPASETYPRLDPSGRHLAFVSDETGRPEVFVMALPDGVPRQVSTAGGRRVWWTRAGAELIYAGVDGSVFTAGFEAPNSTGTPVRLFEAKIARNFADLSYVTPSPDGSRFIIRPAPGAPQPLTLIDNWRALLSR